MHEHGQLPNIQTCAVMVDGLCKGNFLSKAVPFVQVMEKSNLDLSVVIYTILFDEICSVGKLNDA